MEVDQRLRGARRKTKTRAGEGRPQTEGVSSPFNPAFQRLAGFEKRTQREIPSEKVEKPPDPSRQGLDEEQCFLAAVSDVRPLAGTTRRVFSMPDPNLRPAHAAPDEELEAMAHLSDLVSGVAEMDITFTDEYLEGCVHGFSPKLMQRLKRGHFPVQDFLDLHGLTKQEAEVKVRDFLHRSHQLGMRCVLVVHGRGHNSENNTPVLKEQMPVWLGKGPVRKIVLAFATARPYDGGSGALYVLLRRSKQGGGLHWRK
jgi:DNA-nicking Smr family endonuclease